MSETVYCTSCGEGLREETEYCPACGERQKEISDQSTQPSGSSDRQQTAQVSQQPDTQQHRQPDTQQRQSGHRSDHQVEREPNCQRCGTPVAANDWFCSFCGKERPMCPDCGAEMDEKKCKNCGLARQAPCGECGLMISAAVEECPNCGYNESEEVATKSRGRKKKALGLGGVGLVSFFLVSAVIPGPNIIGNAVGALVALPFVSWGGLIAFYYNRKESNAERRTAADLSKGREQNKTKKWRDMKRQERKAMLNAAAEGLNTVGKAAQAYGKKKEKEQKEQQLDERIEAATEEWQEAQQTKQQAIQEKEQAQIKQQEAEEKKEEIEESVPDVPKACPNQLCGTKWRGSGGVLGSKNYEELAPGRFQCRECGETVNLS